MRILVVDDEKDVLDLIELALLSFGGYEVCLASTAKKALATIASSREKFDLLLLDIQMPGMTGIDLCKAIRELPAYRYVPIIMITAMSDKEKIDQAFAVGATDYLNKPFDITELKHRIGLAEKAAFQSEQLTESALSGRKLVKEAQTGNPCSIVDPIPIDDVDGVVRVHVFENYLKQMSRLQFSHTRLLVVKVSNIAAIHSRCTGREFADQVTDISECIASSLYGAPLIAYFGGGIFCIAIDSEYTRNINDTLMHIEDAIFQLAMIFRNGDPVAVDLNAEEIMKPSVFSLTGSVAFVDQLVQELRCPTTSELSGDLANASNVDSAP